MMKDDANEEQLLQETVVSFKRRLDVLESKIFEFQEVEKVLIIAHITTFQSTDIKREERRSRSSERQSGIFEERSGA